MGGGCEEALIKEVALKQDLQEQMIAKGTTSVRCLVFLGRLSLVRLRQ